MNAERTSARVPSPLALAALWFAAAVSLAEIAAGALFAEAGFAAGTFASLAGHAAGAILLYGAAWISWKRGKRAIAVCEGTFGRGGPVLFGLLNFVQLVGWTAVMVIVGARSAQAVLPAPAIIGAAATAGGTVLGGEATWRIVLGALVVLWAVAGPSATGKASAVAAVALAALCAALSTIVFGPFLSGRVSAAARPAGAPDMGSLLELAVVMPLSWLPLVGDYVVSARKGRRAALASAGAYTAGSVWMYAIGLGAMVAAGTGDPVSLLAGPWRFAAAAIILLSTVTTAFLDGRSAGISLNAAIPRLPEGAAVPAAATLGLVLALVAPVERYESFLLLIGAVFAPLYAVLFADFFVRVRGRKPAPSRPAAAFACWAVGVVAYFLIGSRTTLLGTSIPVMALVGLLFSLYRYVGDIPCDS